MIGCRDARGEPGAETGHLGRFPGRHLPRVGARRPLGGARSDESVRPAPLREGGRGCPRAPSGFRGPLGRHLVRDQRPGHARSRVRAQLLGRRVPRGRHRRLVHLRQGRAGARDLAAPARGLATGRDVRAQGHGRQPRRERLFERPLQPDTDQEGRQATAAPDHHRFQHQRLPEHHREGGQGGLPGQEEPARARPQSNPRRVGRHGHLPLDAGDLLRPASRAGLGEHGARGAAGGARARCGGQVPGPDARARRHQECPGDRGGGRRVPLSVREHGVPRQLQHRAGRTSEALRRAVRRLDDRRGRALPRRGAPDRSAGPLFLRGDRYHPNAKGYKIVAEAVLEELAQRP